MLALTRLQTAGCPGSRSSASDAALRVFDPALEAEFERARLLGNRTLIRIACTLSALLAVARGAEQAAIGFWHAAQPTALALVSAASAVLALIAWTRAFERGYLPLARVIVPARSAVVGLLIAGAAAHGKTEMLMILPLMILGPFFFLGLSCGTALSSGALGFAAFNLSAVAFDLPLPVVLRVSGLLIVALAACTIAARHLDRASRRIFHDSRRISELAQHDALTGLKNRGVFDEQLSRLWSRAVEDRRSMAILLIDVDHFKAFNDRYGHQAGDRALQDVARSLHALVSRSGDVLARYGGEEFGVILYDVDASEAERLAERMRRAVGELATVEQGARIPARLTISIGVAFLEPSADRQASGALQLADQALYEAKMRGRDCVAVMGRSAHRLLATGVFRSIQAGAQASSLSAASRR